jgi:NitT/TauT family transport system permease protein
VTEVRNVNAVAADDPDLAGPQDKAVKTPSAARAHLALIAGRIGVVVLIILVWHLTAGNLIKTFYLPRPMAVLGELKEWLDNGSLFRNILATLIPAVKGFTYAAVSAIVLGYGLAMWRYGSQVMEPFIAALYGVPIISLVPLMILWFGIGEELAVGVAFMASFFLMFFTVYFGLREVSQTLIDQVLVAGGSKWDIAWRVRLPSALIWVVAGTKVALPHSVVGVVVAEFLTGNRGVGFMLSSNANQFNSAGTFAAVVVLAAMSFTLDRILFYSTRRALSWKEAGRHS